MGLKTQYLHSIYYMHGRMSYNFLRIYNSRQKTTGDSKKGDNNNKSLYNNFFSSSNFLYNYQVLLLYTF